MTKYRNTYYALRHGISIANEEGIIVSHPDNGTRGWGLSPAGVAHCREALAPSRLSPLRLPADTVTISSDFRRAFETAELFCELNHLSASRLDPRLRERYFGELEKLSQANYLPVWEDDARDPSHHRFGCESTNDVAARLRDLLADTERELDRRTIVLVSHGDPLQILETVFLGLPSNRHRTLTHLGNAELRRLG